MNNPPQEKKRRYQPKKLNPRHKLAAQVYMEGKTQKEAYLTAYPRSAEISAEKSGCRLFSFDTVKQECMRIMERKSGLKVADLLDKLKDLTVAEKDIVLRNELVKVADNPSRVAALQMGFDLLGLRSKSDINIDQRSININIDTEAINILTNGIKSLKDMRLRDDTISGVVE